MNCLNKKFFFLHLKFLQTNLNCPYISSESSEIFNAQYLINFWFYFLSNLTQLALTIKVVNFCAAKMLELQKKHAVLKIG